MTDKMREEFNKWSADQIQRLLAHGEPTAAKVWRDFESLAWASWVASRAAIEVELPIFDDYPASIDAEMRESLRVSITACGLKVKPC